MARLRLVPRHRADRELKAAYDQVARLWGFSTPPPIATRITQCFSNRPHYVLPIGRGYQYIGWGAETPRELLELLAVLISRENECFY